MRFSSVDQDLPGHLAKARTRRHAATLIDFLAGVR